MPVSRLHCPCNAREKKARTYSLSNAIKSESKSCHFSRPDKLTPLAATEVGKIMNYSLRLPRSQIPACSVSI